MLLALGTWISWSTMLPDDARRLPRRSVACLSLWLARRSRGDLPGLEADPARGPSSKELFSATRLPFLSSGVSPLPTGMFMGVLYIFWCLNRLGRIRSGLHLPEREAVDRCIRSSLDSGPGSGIDVEK